MPIRLSDLHPERGVLRLLTRAPIWLYRAHLGWLLGDRVLMLTHTGRKSGLRRQTVLEVVRHDRATDTYVIAAGWGERADWLRNVEQRPEVMIDSGRHRIEARAERLSIEAAEDELRDYARRHPRGFRTLARLIIGQRVRASDADYGAFARGIPMVALRPVPQHDKREES